MTAPAPTINPKAITWTIGVHVLLLLLFLVIKYTVPPAPVVLPEAGGLEVNLGTSDNGFGTYQPQDPDEPANSSSKASRSAAAAAPLPDMMQDAAEDNPVVNTAVRTANKASGTNASRNTSRMASNNQDARTAAQQVQKPRYLYPAATGRGGNGAQVAVPGGAEGNTSGPGDRGVPHGTPGAPNYTGTPGNGTGGVNYSISGRSMVAFPPKEAEFREGGKVVVRVTVNRSGAIVGSNIISASSSELSDIALRKLRSVRFNKSDNAPQEQFGTITFMFRAGH